MLWTQPELSESTVLSFPSTCKRSIFSFCFVLPKRSFSETGELRTSLRGRAAKTFARGSPNKNFGRARRDEEAIFFLCRELVDFILDRKFVLSQGDVATSIVSLR